MYNSVQELKDVHQIPFGKHRQRAYLEWVVRHSTDIIAIGGAQYQLDFMDRLEKTKNGR